jgi:hypothetical protein
MLAQLRQFNLGLVLANQYLAQWTSSNQAAIEGTVGTMISFEISADDATAMKIYMNTFDKEDLVSLGKFRAAVSMRYDDRRLDAFTLETLPPPGHGLDDQIATEREQLIRRRSVANYTPKSYDEVITWLKQRYFGDGNSHSQQAPADNSGDDDGIEEG